MKKQSVPVSDLGISAGLRRYLYATAAITGAAILIVEILGAKMLAPYVGMSHFVWTAQIAVTLVSLAVGYCLGGWLVDRSARLDRLYTCILLAAIYLCLTVLVREPVAYACLRFRLAAGALLASAVLFFVPLTLLATTCPFLVRALTASVSSVGGQVGRVTAISTVGSVVGTVLIGYVLLPFLPNSLTMYLTAGALLLVAAAYFLVWGRNGRRPLTVCLGALLGLGLGYAGVSRDDANLRSNIYESYRGNSHFGLMQVIESKSGSERYYLNDYLTQNKYDAFTRQSTAMFTWMLHGLARAYTRHIEDVLCIGLGVGIVPMQFAREGAKVDVAEINPAVVPLATRFFNLEKDRLNIFIGDGRYFLNCCARRYDTIILDAFLGDSSPSHLMTREAFRAMLQVLKPGGTLVINRFGDLDPGQDYYAASLEKTLKAVFRSVRIHQGYSGNMLFVASAEPALVVLNPPDFEAVHPHCRGDVEAAFAGVVQSNPNHGRVLTDDYNPVEFYDAANRERLRRQLAFSMRPH